MNRSPGSSCQLHGEDKQEERVVVLWFDVRLDHYDEPISMLSEGHECLQVGRDPGSQGRVRA